MYDDITRFSCVEIDKEHEEETKNQENEQQKELQYIAKKAGVKF